MGQNSSRGKQQVHISLNHPKFSKCKLLQYNDQEIISATILCDEKGYNAWKSLLEKTQIDHPNLLTAKNYNYKSTGVCGSRGVVEIGYDYYPHLLTQQIQNRKTKNKSFTQPQLWYLLYAYLSAKNYLKQKTSNTNGLIGDIRPQNVFINVEQQIKFVNIFSWPNQRINYEKTFDDIATYLSPQDIEQLQLGSMKNTKNVSSEHFSIGFTLVAAAILKDHIDLYDAKKKSFNNYEAKKRIEIFKRCTLYSELLRAIIGSLCSFDVKKRLSLDLVWSWMTKYERKITSKQPFMIDQVPPKINQHINILRSEFVINPESSQAYFKSNVENDQRSRMASYVSNQRVSQRVNQQIVSPNSNVYRSPQVSNVYLQGTRNSITSPANFAIHKVLKSPQGYYAPKNIIQNHQPFRVFIQYKSPTKVNDRPHAQTAYINNRQQRKQDDNKSNGSNRKNRFVQQVSHTSIKHQQSNQPEIVYKKQSPIHHIIDEMVSRPQYSSIVSENVVIQKHQRVFEALADLQKVGVQQINTEYVIPEKLQDRWESAKQLESTLKITQKKSSSKNQRHNSVLEQEQRSRIADSFKILRGLSQKASDHEDQLQKKNGSNIAAHHQKLQTPSQIIQQIIPIAFEIPANVSRKGSNITQNNEKLTKDNYEVIKAMIPISKSVTQKQQIRNLDDEERIRQAITKKIVEALENNQFQQPLLKQINIPLTKVNKQEEDYHFQAQKPTVQIETKDIILKNHIQPIQQQSNEQTSRDRSNDNFTKDVYHSQPHKQDNQQLIDVENKIAYGIEQFIRIEQNPTDSAISNQYQQNLNRPLLHLGPERVSRHQQQNIPSLQAGHHESHRTPQDPETSNDHKLNDVKQHNHQKEHHHSDHPEQHDKIDRPLLNLGPEKTHHTEYQQFQNQLHAHRQHQQDHKDVQVKNDSEIKVLQKGHTQQGHHESDRPLLNLGPQSHEKEHKQNNFDEIQHNENSGHEQNSHQHSVKYNILQVSNGSDEIILPPPESSDIAGQGQYHHQVVQLNSSKIHAKDSSEQHGIKGTFSNNKTNLLDSQFGNISEIMNLNKLKNSHNTTNIKEADKSSSNNHQSQDFIHEFIHNYDHKTHSKDQNTIEKLEDNPVHLSEEDRRKLEIITSKLQGNHTQPHDTYTIKQQVHEFITTSYNQNQPLNQIRISVRDKMNEISNLHNSHEIDQKQPLKLHVKNIQTFEQESKIQVSYTDIRTETHINDIKGDALKLADDHRQEQLAISSKQQRASSQYLQGVNMNRITNHSLPQNYHYEANEFNNHESDPLESSKIDVIKQQLLNFHNRQSQHHSIERDSRKGSGDFIDDVISMNRKLGAEIPEQNKYLDNPIALEELRQSNPTGQETTFLKESLVNQKSEKSRKSSGNWDIVDETIKINQQLKQQQP